MHWNQSRIRHVLLHEYQHITRLDWVSLFAGKFACAIFWFNPLVWLACRRMAELAEHACDDGVLLNDSNNTEYAENLVVIAKAAKNHKVRYLMAQAIAGSFLGQRIHAILSTTRIRKFNDMEWVLPCCVCVLLLVGLLSSIKLVVPTAEIQTAPPFSGLITIKLLANSDPRQALPLPDPAEKPELLVSMNFPAMDTVIIEPRYEQTLGKLLIPEVILEEFPAFSDKQSPQVLKKTFPRYPDQAKTKGISGYAVIEYTVDKKGNTQDASIIESVPAGIFERNAIQAIYKYRFSPPLVNGEPVAIKGLRTRFVFQIDPDSG